MSDLSAWIVDACHVHYCFGHLESIGVNETLRTKQASLGFESDRLHVLVVSEWISRNFKFWLLHRRKHGLFLVTIHKLITAQQSLLLFLIHVHPFPEEYVCFLEVFEVL